MNTTVRHQPPLRNCGMHEKRKSYQRLFSVVILIGGCLRRIRCIHTITKLSSPFQNVLCSFHPVGGRRSFSPFSRPRSSACQCSSRHVLLFSKGFSQRDFMEEQTKKLKKKEKKKKNVLINDEVFLTTSNNAVVDEPKLDRFGLPIPTEKDLFPPMPLGTEIIPATAGKLITTQDEIDEILCQHAIKIDLSTLQKLSTASSHDDHRLKLRLLHQSPPVLAVENFFSKEECQYCMDLVQSADGNDDVLEVSSATFSSTLAQSKRTSTTWYVSYRILPTFLAKLTALLSNISLEQCEEPQIVRYLKGEEFTWHYDEVPTSQLKNGGQRIATALVYLNDVLEGGGTVFRDLVVTTSASTGGPQQQLSMQPKQGSLLLFFPAFANGIPDERTLHKGEKVVSGTKMIAQMWIHQRQYMPVLPKGNSHEDARESVETRKRELGL
jgi:prolyl 4-hydroxylase